MRLWGGGMGLQSWWQPGVGMLSRGKDLGSNKMVEAILS